MTNARRPLIIAAAWLAASTALVALAWLAASTGNTVSILGIPVASGGPGEPTRLLPGAAIYLIVAPAAAGFAARLLSRPDDTGVTIDLTDRIARRDASPGRSGDRPADLDPVA